ncbi:MAG: hypothetical protein LUQ31_08090 [Methanoregula sp.]|nr:hypothetical protein [Methanoregula sp.]
MTRTGIIGILLVLICIPCQVSAVEGNSRQKIFVMDYLFDNTGVTGESAGIWYGTPPDPGIRSGSIEGIVYDSQHRAVMEFYIRDPRIQYGNSAGKNPDNSTTL